MLTRLHAYGRLHQSRSLGKVEAFTNTQASYVYVFVSRLSLGPMALQGVVYMLCNTELLSSVQGVIADLANFAAI